MLVELFYGVARISVFEVWSIDTIEVEPAVDIEVLGRAGAFPLSGCLTLW
jgi:hypothetical protein